MSGRSITIRLSQGSITRAKVPAIVLGHAQGMTPDGAERAVDKALDGAISIFLEDRSLKGALGEFFAIPCGLAPLPADTVIIMGMGPPDIFTKTGITEKDKSSALYQIAHRLVKGLLATGVLQFATVPIGAGGAGLPVRSAVKEYVVGICQALETLDQDGEIRDFSIVEVDAFKLADIRKGVQDAGRELQGRFAFEVLEIKLPDSPTPDAVPSARRSALLVVRRKGRELTYSLYNERPVQFMKTTEIDDTTMRELIQTLTVYLRDGTGADGLKATAQLFYELLVPPEIRDQVRDVSGNDTIMLNLESTLTPVPWELCYDREAGAFLGELSLGRQILREETYRLRPRNNALKHGVDILILADLANNLPRAKEEGLALKQYLEHLHSNGCDDMRVDLLTAGDLRNGQKKSQLLKLIYQGRYEIIHYCGHAFYDRLDPYKSGWVIGQEEQEVIRAYEFSNLAQPPVFVFSNACESAIMSDGMEAEAHAFCHSLAGAFLRSGVNLYIGNQVEVLDASACRFAQYFYEGFFRDHLTIGAAMSRARKLMRPNDLSDPTWANYVLYGSPVFLLSGD